MHQLFRDPEVSVLMPAYNREHYIEDSVISILNQTYTNFELIILNDGSSDKTLEKISAFKDSRIRVIQNHQNRGIAFSRNRLLEEAKGKFLVLLDSDDISFPERLEVQLDFLKKNQDLLMVGTPCVAIDQNGAKIKSTWAFLQKRPTTPEEIKASLLFRNCFFQSSIMINVELLNNRRYDLNFPPFEDYELWTRLAATSQLANLENAQIMYRFHPENVSHKTNESFKFELNNKIIKNQFSHYFNYVPTAKELFIHGAWQFYTYEVGYDFLKDSRNWLNKIKELNRSNDVFDEAVFDSVVKRNWFDRCYHHLNKGNPYTAFYFLFFNPYFSIKDIKLFIYLFLKGMHTLLSRKSKLKVSKLNIRSSKSTAINA
jgi:glycosyltransferase involved in cell wall biosynthesis